MLNKMINFDNEGFEELVWYYSEREGIITSKTWEKIICKSCNGQWIPGDIYMADGVLDKYGLNVKSRNVTFTKGDIQTLDLIQCRCPISNADELEDDHLGTKILNTLKIKRKASFLKFNLSKMLDVDVLHYRIDDEYNVRLFVTEQPNYENLKFTWKNGHGYENNSKSWKLKRVPSDNKAYHNCLHIKKVYLKHDVNINLKVKSYDNYDISIEDAKQEYKNCK